MTNIVAAKPAFRTVTAAQVMQALDDPDPANPIAGEVARFIAGYTAHFKAHVEHLGSFPADILRLKGQCAIEEIAMRLTTEAIQDELSRMAPKR